MTTNCITKEVLIHCKPSLLDKIKEYDLNWFYSPRFGIDEVDVIVEDDKDRDDEDLCAFFNLDYDQVNCIELL